MEDNELTFTPEQEKALKAILCRQPVFLAGGSGTGKNTVLREAILCLKRDGINVAMCSAASKGAQNIDGVSLHSFFSLPLHLLKEGELPVPDISKLMKAQVLIVNYIHACTPTLIDIIWKAVSMAREKGHEVQVVFSGDPLSLNSARYSKDQDHRQSLTDNPIKDSNVVRSRHWEDFGFVNFELTKDLRHCDPSDARILEEMRMGKCNSLEEMRLRLSPSPIEGAIYICSKKPDVSSINAEGTRKLSGTSYTFRADTFGEMKEAEYPAPSTLVLKEKMPIIMVANVPAKRLISGMVGRIVTITGDRIYAVFPHRQGRILIERHQWTSEEGWHFIQFPFDVAFAITSYRARYLTLEEANLKGSFSLPGQLYTALSRVLDLRRVHMDHDPNRKELNVDKEAMVRHKCAVQKELPFDPKTLSTFSQVPYRRRDHMRFGLMPYTYAEERKATFICLRVEPEDQVCGLTDFSKYLRPASRLRDIHSDIGDDAYYAVLFFNFALIDSPHRVDSLSEITPALIQEFLNLYALGLYGRGNACHTEDTIKKCTAKTLNLLQAILEDESIAHSYKLSDLFTTHFKLTRSGRVDERTELSFDIFYDPVEHTTFRDMPPEVVQEMINVAYEKYPNILMNIALGLCAGLRPSETCCLSLDSLRSVHGGERFPSVFIDLEHTVRLRDDGVEVGEIKVPRMARVQPIYEELFDSLYTRYMEWRTEQPSDPRYRPLCLDSNGKAMTYHTLRNQFKALMDEVTDGLMGSKNSRVRAFIEYYIRYGLGFHVLRHVYTVNLVLAGYDVKMIMNARGDRNPLSALHYLEEKGILVEKANITVSHLVNCTIAAAAAYKRKRRKC